MSEVIPRLVMGRELAWSTLRPAFDHAIALAKEAEYEAYRASNSAETYVAPAYPVLVSMLAESVDLPPVAEVPF